MQRLRIALTLVLRGDRVLLTRRPEGKHLAGLWEFPGGKVERGESAAEAAARELLEETGLEAGVLEAWPAVRHAYETDEVSVELLPFVVREARGGVREGVEHAWVPVTELWRYDLPEANAPLVARLWSL